MDTVVSVLVWGALMVLMMKLCGSHMGGRAHADKGGKAVAETSHGGCCGGKKRKAGGGERVVWEAPEKDVDPVCGNTVATADARPSVYQGQVYYFCSRECREAFEAAPAHYLGQSAPTPARGAGDAQAKGESHDHDRACH